MGDSPIRGPQPHTAIGQRGETPVVMASISLWIIPKTMEMVESHVGPPGRKSGPTES